MHTEKDNDITSPGCSEQDFQCHHVRVINFVHKAEEALAFCTDIGAPRFVVGVKHLRKIRTYLYRKGIPAIPSKRKFQFGDIEVASKGMIELTAKPPDHIPPINDLLEVVDVDIPDLLGLDVLDGHILVLDNVTNRLWKRQYCHMILSSL